LLPSQQVEVYYYEHNYANKYQDPNLKTA